MEVARNIHVVIESRPADSMILRLMRWFATHAKTTAFIAWAVIVVLGISGHAALLNEFGINLFSLARWDELLFLWIDASATFPMLGKVLCACLGLFGGYAMGVLMFERTLEDLGWWQPWRDYENWLARLNERGRTRPGKLLTIYLSLVILAIMAAASLLDRVTTEAMEYAFGDRLGGAAGWFLALLLGGLAGAMFAVATTTLCSFSVIIKPVRDSNREANLTLYAVALMEVMVVFGFLIGTITPAVSSVTETFPDTIRRQQPYIVEYMRKDVVCVQTGYLFSTFGGYHVLYDWPAKAMHLIPTRAVQHMQRQRPEREPDPSDTPWLRISTCTPAGLPTDGHGSSEPSEP